MMHKETPRYSNPLLTEDVQEKGIHSDKKIWFSNNLINIVCSGGLKYIDKRKGSYAFSGGESRKFKDTQIEVSSFKNEEEKASLSFPITMRDIEPTP